MNPPAFEPIRLLFAFISTAALIGGAGCGDRNEYVAPPPPKVQVVQPIVGNVDVAKEFPATTAAFEIAEIRARVPGYLEEPKFTAGHFVEKDQELFQIEREEYEIRLKSAQAESVAARAQADLAMETYNKRNEASGSGAVSKIDVAAAKAEWDAAEAAVLIAKAKEEDADRALRYTTVRAPFAGIVSRTLVDTGNLVGADGPTLLTTVVSQDPIYVEFEGSQREVLDKLPLRPGADQEGYDQKFKDAVVRLILSDGSEYAKTGKMEFIDNRFNAETGTMRARAVFDNPDGQLAAGMFVKLVLDTPVEGAIQVPVDALQRDIGGTYVVVVDEDGIAARRNVVETGFVKDGMSILESGLTADDRVIVSNLQRARPGLAVKVEDAPPPAEEPAAPEGGVDDAAAGETGGGSN